MGKRLKEWLATGQNRGRSFVSEEEGEELHWQSDDLVGCTAQWRYTCRNGPEKRHSVCEDFQEKPWIGRTAPRVGDGKNKLQKRNVHLKYTHIEEIQHYTDLSLQETWPAHTEKR